MIKEKHVLTNPYNHHALSRYVDVYEVSANRCHSVPESGYKGTEATLVDEPAWNEKFSSYSITGATLTGNNFILNNDVTAQANYETAKNVTTINCNSTKNSGFIGDTASLSDTPAWNEKFSSYSITGSTLTGNNFRFTGSDITAQANFETAKNVTTTTDGQGTITASPKSGFIGTQVTLTNTPNAGYTFQNYSITGATLTGNKFNLTGANVTARANFLENAHILSNLGSTEYGNTGKSVNVNLQVPSSTNYNYVDYYMDVKYPNYSKAMQWGAKGSKWWWTTVKNYQVGFIGVTGTVNGFNAQAGQSISSFLEQQTTTTYTTFYTSPILATGAYTHYKVLFDRSARRGYIYLGPNTLVGYATLNADPIPLCSAAYLKTNMFIKNVKVAGFNTKAGAEVWTGQT